MSPQKKEYSIHEETVIPFALVHNNKLQFQTNYKSTDLGHASYPGVKGEKTENGDREGEAVNEKEKREGDREGGKEREGERELIN